MNAQTLEITDSGILNPGFEFPPGFDRVFLGHYGDNGGDPDGNAWLPSEPVGLDIDTRWLVSNGYASVIEAAYTNDVGALSNAGIHDLSEDWADDESLVETVKAWFDDNTYGWAHYGAYGTSDSTWVYIPLA